MTASLLGMFLLGMLALIVIVLAIIGITAIVLTIRELKRKADQPKWEKPTT